MVRGLVACIALCFAVASAFADPKIDSAISIFKQTWLAPRVDTRI